MPEDFKVKDWLPQEPWQGPPLPEFLNIYWPWYTPPVAAPSLDLVISGTRAVPEEYGDTPFGFCVNWTRSVTIHSMSEIKFIDVGVGWGRYSYPYAILVAPLVVPALSEVSLKFTYSSTLLLKDGSTVIGTPGYIPFWNSLLFYQMYHDPATEMPGGPIYTKRYYVPLRPDKYWDVPFSGEVKIDSLAQNNPWKAQVYHILFSWQEVPIEGPQAGNLGYHYFLLPNSVRCTNASV